MTRKERNTIFNLHQISRFLDIGNLILIGIFIFAIILRIHVDPGIPFHYDPGKNIVYARAALHWFPFIPQYNPYFNLGEYFEYQVLFPYITAALSKIPGVTLVEAAKWLAIISGAALALTVYYLSYEMFHIKTAALISAFLIAVSKIQLLQYINYYPQILATTLMPLSFLFLSRYVRNQEFKNMIIVAVLTSLIVLCSYIAALVYLIILLVSLAVWSFFDKKTLKALVLAPLMTILLLTFFWLPIVWRHGFLQVIQTAVSVIIRPTTIFTNEPWTFSTFLALSYGSIIAIGVIVFAIIIMKRIKWDFQKMLLAVWLVTTFLLMVSYLFRPILWVDRYCPFFEIAVIICAGAALYVLIKTINNIKYGPKYKGYLLLLILIIPLLSGIDIDYPFRAWGYPSDFAMVEYMQENLPPDSLVVAPPGINGFWVSGLSGVKILGGESSQMIRHQFLGDQDSEDILNAGSAEHKMELIRKYGVNYIYIPLHRRAFNLWNYHIEREGFESFNNATYFEVETGYQDKFGYTFLVKVRENVQPQYHVENINWTVTIAGYLVSITSLFGFVYVQRKHIQVRIPFIG
jgi:hypothetical protein